MVYSTFYGEISDERKQEWDCKSDNPYAVLKNNMKIDCNDWIAFIHNADELFTDKIQIDWGSYAWKADKKSILQFVNKIKGKIEEQDFMNDSGVYGVVFIEEVS